MKRSKWSALVTILVIGLSLAAVPFLGAHVAQECGAVGCPWYVDAGGAMLVALLAPSGVGAVVAAGVFGA